MSKWFYLWNEKKQQIIFHLILMLWLINSIYGWSTSTDWEIRDKIQWHVLNKNWKKQITVRVSKESTSLKL